MARIWVDDLDDSTPAVRTVRIEYGDEFYELDLGHENLSKYEDALLPFLAVARKIDPATVNAPPIPEYTPVTGQFKAIAAAAAPAKPAAAVAPPAAAPAAPAPAPVAAAPAPAPAPKVQQAPVSEPEPEPVQAPAQPRLRLEPEPEPVADPVPFASLEFEPEPERALASVGASTNGHQGAHRVTIARPKPNPAVNKDLPPVPELNDRVRAAIREWKAKHPVYKDRGNRGVLARDVYWAWVEDVTKDEE